MQINYKKMYAAHKYAAHRREKRNSTAGTCLLHSAWATSAFILYRAGLGVYAIKTSTIQDNSAARGERPAKR